MDLKDYFTEVKDFPKKGILFRDMSPLLARPAAFSEAINQLDQRAQMYHPTHILGIESRGFPLGAALAYKMQRPLVMVRKAGKLPPPVLGHTYNLEYGTDRLEIKDGILGSKDRVVLVDDVLATGGTAEAAAALVHQTQALPLALICILELLGLEGRQRLEGIVKVETLVSFA